MTISAAPGWERRRHWLPLQYSLAALRSWEGLMGSLAHPFRIRLEEPGSQPGDGERPLRRPGTGTADLIGSGEDVCLLERRIFPRRRLQVHVSGSLAQLQIVHLATQHA